MIPLVFSQNNFVQNSIIPIVFSGTKIRLKAATWPAMNFFAGNIHLMLHSGQVGNLNRYWWWYTLTKLFCEECYYFPMVLSGKKIRSTTATWSVPNFKRVNWRCYIWIKSANLIEHNHCDIESWYNSNADSRWKTQIKVLPFVFWQNNFVQNSIIPMVFSGTRIRLKAATWPAMNFLPGNIHLMLHSGQVGNLKR